MPEKIKLEISAWTVVKVLLVIITFFLLYYIRDIVALFFIVLILTASFSPIVASWSKKIGRIPSVTILIILLVIFFSLVVYLVIPPLVSQFKQLAQNAPTLMNRYGFIKDHLPSLQEWLTTLSQNFSSITGGFISATVGIFGGFITFFTAIIMTVYLLLDKNSLPKVVNSVVSPSQQEPVLNVARKISEKVGDWFRGQLFLCIIIAVVDYIGLLMLGVPYAMILAILSGVLEIVPTIGPLISGAVAIIITLSVSPLKALLVLILYVIVQQLENSLIVPKVMQKAVGLSPVVVILAILIGGKILGIVGAIIAVPIAASVSVIFREWPNVRSIFSKNG